MEVLFSSFKKRYKDVVVHSKIKVLFKQNKSFAQFLCRKTKTAKIQVIHIKDFQIGKVIVK